MRNLTQQALESARRAGATYADIRIIENRQEFLSVKKGNVDTVSSGRSHGFGLRVIADGAWGFASSSRLEAAEIDRVADLAVRIARASALTKKTEVRLAPVEAVDDRWNSNPKIDPFAVKTEEKLGFLLDVDKRLKGSPEIRVTQAQIQALGEKKIFASTEGSYIEQQLTQTGGAIYAYAAAEGEVQLRSYPALFGGDFALKGYEHIEELDFLTEAERVGREAGQLVKAEQCPSGRRDLIISGSHLALQLHESCGHPIELDRVLGTEAGLVGKSFLTLDKFRSGYRYGSEAVSIFADSTIPGANGSLGYDDEGVPAQRTQIVDCGEFVGYLTSRETAPAIGQTSNGAMMANGWDQIPLVRMTNVCLEPGDWTLDEMIKDTKDGLLLDLSTSYSIDDRRYNFQFSTEVAWEIKDGSITRMLKNPTYTSVTPEFWGSCDAVAGKDEWKVWGIPNCGKGEPMQPIRVGHGTAPARFRQVKVGVGKW
ncbi:MAG: TldD/PmbA family protein [Bacillota bacterium]